MAAAPTTLPGTEAPTTTRGEQHASLLPPWSVILHNDDHHDMLYVVRCLVKSITALGQARAFQVMLEAHTSGRAVVITCPLEHAELYRERLQSSGLTATLEKA